MAWNFFKKKTKSEQEDKGLSDLGKKSLDLLLHPATKAAGVGISLLAAAIFGGVHLSKRRKQLTKVEAHEVSLKIIDQLQGIRNQLSECLGWINAQKGTFDYSGMQTKYATLKKIYTDWIAHDRMQEILNTIQDDPQIGMNISNGLHELSRANLEIEKLLMNEKADAAQLVPIRKNLEKAIRFFGIQPTDKKE